MEFATSLVHIVREYMTHPATEVTDSVLAGEIIGVLEPPHSVATYSLMNSEFITRFWGVPALRFLHGMLDFTTGARFWFVLRGLDLLFVCSQIRP